MSIRLMSRRHTRPLLVRSLAVIEPLEDRRLLSASAVVAPAPVVVTPPHQVATATAHLVTMHPFDDDGYGGYDGGGSDSGGETSFDDGGGDDSGDGGEGAGSVDTGGDDGGEGAGSVNSGGSDDSGEGAGNSSGSSDNGGGSTITSPVDNNPTGGGTDNSGGNTDNGNSDNGGGGGGGGFDDGGTTDDGTESVILYPTGDPYDDSLYDDGGGTILAITPAPKTADFGGALHVKLPSNPVVGDSGVATVDVFNTGGRAAGKFEIALGVTPDGSAASAIRVADREVSVHLGHDRVAVYKVPFTLPATLTPGTYQFLALVDAGNNFAEANETDNVAVGPTVTVAPAVSDVSVTSVNTHAAARSGRPVAVAVHLRAMGSVVESGTTTITITATPVDGSAAPVQLAAVNRRVRLARGQAATLRLRVPLPAMPAGQYVLTVTVTPVSAADTNGADKSAVTKPTVVLDPLVKGKRARP